MSRLTLVDFRTLDVLLKSLGFRVVRQKGRHVFYRHSDGRTTVVPDHGSQVIVRPLLREILRQIDLTPEQFQNELGKL